MHVSTKSIAARRLSACVCSINPRTYHIWNLRCKPQRCHDSPSRQLENEGEKIFPRFCKIPAPLSLNPVSAPVFDRFEVDTEYKVELLQDVWEFYGEFVNPAFKSIWPYDDYYPVVQYAYITRTSSCCKRS